MYYSALKHPDFIGLCRVLFSDKELNIKAGTDFYLYPVPIQIQTPDNFFAAIKTDFGFVGVHEKDIEVLTIFDK